MNRRIIYAIIALQAFTSHIYAQNDRLITDENTFNTSGATRNNGSRDTTSNKEIPRGLAVWTVSPLSGERTSAIPDTTSYLRMNHVFASGVYGEYNTLGNNGTPRQNRIFTDREENTEFPFTNHYDQIIIQPSDFHFTNTYSPITNLSYNTCGDRTNGEDRLKAVFAVNVNKRLGVGFKFDYLYARGYYANQSTSHFNYTLWGSYLGDRYETHFLLSTNHQKQAENGGITNDEYITHPESFSEDFISNEIPVVLSSNWNKNDNQHIFFTQRYNVGFNRKVKMTEKEIEAKKFAMASQKEKEERERRKKEANGETIQQAGNSRLDIKDAPAGRPEGAKIMGDEPVKEDNNESGGRIQLTSEQAADSLKAEKEKEEEDEFMKNEYVPVTSFFHTLTLDHFRHTYLAYQSPTDFYLNDYYSLDTDSINDRTRYTYLRNNVGVSLLEGFNKWAKAGIKLYAAQELEHIALPEPDGRFSVESNNSFIVGGEISKRQGNALHFRALGETYIAGAEAGQVRINGDIDVNIPLLGDTVRIDARGGFEVRHPNCFMEKYQSRHFKWDNELDNITHTHIEGNLSSEKLRARLRVAFDNITNYTYLSTTYNIDEEFKRTGLDLAPRQASSVQVLTAQLYYNLAAGIFHWDNILTFQKTSDDTVLPLPKLNVYSTAYLRFKIARVLHTDLGVDVRYFTRYDAPEYNPHMQSFVIQENNDIRTSVGNYPVCNVYANFQLKSCRFFVMMSHVNCSNKGNYFLTPHHPLNGRLLRFGVNWNFFN